MYDEKKANEFAGKVLGDTSTSQALAARTRLSERHLREWLAAMSAAGYLEYRPATAEFVLPAEHAPVLAEEAGPMFFGGAYEMAIGVAKPLDRIIESFRTGGGVPQSAYPESTYDGMERFTAGWFENFLLPVWIPAAGLGDRLSAGIEVADVGCGRGRALIKLAKEFPASRFVGYDVYGPNVARARNLAEEAGVAERVTFVERDVTDGLPATFDLITTFDVIHDAADPQGLLRSIRHGLNQNGTYLCLDINCSAKVEENRGPIGAFFYGCSILYCMPTSLANRGAGLGTCGFSEPVVKELAVAAGFGAVNRVEIENPFNNLYVLR